jgi:glycosyltransferase involved in cell wall biosynthesis
MVSISVCMIVKNEETDLERCLDCIRNIADEIIIVDTGSSDRTKEIAFRYTNDVYDFEWSDDFSAARNFSFSKATKDYIYTADADEIIDAENQEKFAQLKGNLSSEIEIVQMKYANQLQFGSIYNFDVEYRPKLYKRLRPFHWIDPIHESVNTKVVIFDSDIVVIHMPLTLHATRDFSIFERYTSNENGISPKIHCLYARELFFTGTDDDFRSAFPYFEVTLHDEKRSLKEIRASQCIVARSARLRQDEFTFIKTALKGIVGTPVAEVCCELGDYYFEKQDYEEAAIWYYTAAFGAESELNIHYSGDYPLGKLSECFNQMGNSKECEKYKELASSWTVPACP